MCGVYIANAYEVCGITCTHAISVNAYVRSFPFIATFVFRLCTKILMDF